MSVQFTGCTAYSYIRFSSPQQAEGDSLRRQTERAQEYCDRRGWRLDTALTLRDLGVSAFRGDNALNGNLGTFLAAIERKTVRPGSVLIVESFDRISRQGIDEGYEIVKRILKADVRIVTLSPEREFDRDATKSLSKGALEIQLILERAAEESEMKSKRVGAAWTKKRERTRAGVIMTNQLPFWIIREGDRLALHPVRVAAVRRIFDLAIAGYGIPSIIKTLTREKIPAFGRSGRWNRAYIGYILRDRRVVGEYKPLKGKKADEPPVPNYYPAAVCEVDWLRARAAIRQRSRYVGRTSETQINLFSGLIVHARDESESYIMSQRYNRSNGRYYPVLLNNEGDAGPTRHYSIPYGPFESEFLSKLREIKPADILPGSKKPDQTARISAESEAVEIELAKAKEFMERKGFSETIGERITTLEARQRELAAELADERQRAANPLGEAWGAALTVADVLKTAADTRDARLRLRGLLRSIVESMQLLMVVRGKRRLCALQCNFVGGRSRTYLIEFMPASGFNKERCTSDSFDAAARLDLRKKPNVAKVEQILEGR